MLRKSKNNQWSLYDSFTYKDHADVGNMSSVFLKPFLTPKFIQAYIDFEFHTREKRHMFSKRKTVDQAYVELTELGRR